MFQPCDFGPCGYGPPVTIVQPTRVVRPPPRVIVVQPRVVVAPRRTVVIKRPPIVYKHHGWGWNGGVGPSTAFRSSPFETYQGNQEYYGDNSREYDYQRYRPGNGDGSPGWDGWSGRGYGPGMEGPVDGVPDGNSSY